MFQAYGWTGYLQLLMRQRERIFNTKVLPLKLYSAASIYPGIFLCHDFCLVRWLPRLELLCWILEGLKRLMMSMISCWDCSLTKTLFLCQLRGKWMLLRMLYDVIITLYVMYYTSVTLQHSKGDVYTFLHSQSFSTMDCSSQNTKNSGAIP